MKAKLVLHHDDSPCYERLQDNGYCESCGFHPDMQSTCFHYYCPTCDIELNGMKCSSCNNTFTKDEIETITKTVNSEDFKKRRDDVLSCISKSCRHCIYRSIDGVPEPYPVCSHPSIKTRMGEYIIDYKKNPNERPKKCPLRKDKYAKRYLFLIQESEDIHGW